MSFEDFHQLVETLAIIFGGFGLAYRLLRGAFVPSLRLSLDASRQAIGTRSGEDLLDLRLSLENSGRVNLALEQVRLRVIDGIEGHDNVKRIPLMRCEFDAENENHDAWNPKGARPINIAPSDSTHVGWVFRIPANEACVVEGVVIASDWFLTFADRNHTCLTLTISTVISSTLTVKKPRSGSRSM